MAKVIITKPLEEEINKHFKKQSIEIFALLLTLENNPLKGNILSAVGNILLKEIRYRNYRFYFIVDGYKLKVLSKENLTDLLLKFVRMSDKKHQQETINEIKNILKIIGPSGF